LDFDFHFGVLFWSALTCQRFGRLRPVAVIGEITKPVQSRSVVEDGGDRSPKTKAVTGYRTPNYPLVWTNKNYKMLYLNMGHNDIDYEHKYDATNKTLSYTLNNPIQNRLIIDGLLWLGNRDKKAP
jgi:hypothetical protein